MRPKGELWARLTSRNDYCFPSLIFVAGQTARFQGDFVTLIETVPAGSIGNYGSVMGTAFALLRSCAELKSHKFSTQTTANA